MCSSRRAPATAARAGLPVNRDRKPALRRALAVSRPFTVKDISTATKGRFAVGVGRFHNQVGQAEAAQVAGGDVHNTLGGCQRSEVVP